jgi:hypothetical protein
MLSDFLESNEIVYRQKCTRIAYTGRRVSHSSQVTQGTCVFFLLLSLNCIYSGIQLLHSMANRIIIHVASNN